MPNEFDAAFATFRPDPEALKNSRLRRRKSDEELIREGYEEQSKLIEEQAKEQQRADEEMARERERRAKEQASMEEDRAKAEIAAANDQNEPLYRREGRPTYTDSAGRILPVDDDATWAAKQQEKRLEEEQKAQAKADAAFRKAEAVRLNQAENKLEGGLDTYKQAGNIASQAVQAKAGEISTLTTQVKALEENAITEQDLARLDALKQRLDAARNEKAQLEDNERTLNIAKTNRELELAPERRAIEQQRAALPITTAPKLDGVRNASVDVPNPNPTPASQDAARTAAVLRDHITVLREKGDFERAAALEKRLTQPEAWKAEQAAFRAQATPEALVQAIQDEGGQILNRHTAIREQYATLKQQQQVYVDRLNAAQADNERLLSGTYSDADTVNVTDQATGEVQKWHKTALQNYHQAASSLRQWEQQNRGQIDLLDIEQQQLAIDAANVDRHQRALQFKQREAQREQDAQRAQSLTRLRQEPGMAAFADEIEQETAEATQRAADIERKYTDPNLRKIAFQTLSEDMGKRQAERTQRMEAKREEAATLYTDWGKDLNVTDWINEKDVSARLRQEAEKRGLTEQEGRLVLDAARKLDWNRPMVGPQAQGDLRGGQDNGPVDMAEGAVSGFKQLINGEQVAEPVRVLADGRLTVNPALHLDRKAYEGAVQAASTTPEAKQAALKQFERLHELAGVQALSVLESEVGPFDFNDWRTQKLKTEPTFARKSLGTQANEFIAEMKTRPDWQQYGDTLLRKLAKGVTDVGAMASGVAALIYGPIPGVGEYFANAGSANLNLGQALSGATSLKGGSDSFALRAGGLVAELIPQIVPMMVGGGLLTGTGRMGAVQAAALMGGMQTTGLQQASTYQNLRAQLNPATGKPYTHLEAWSKSAPGAIASGIVTGMLTALGGRTGGEAAAATLLTRAGREAAKQAFRDSYSTVWKGLKTITGHALGEYLEEAPDELFSQISEEISTKGRSANLGRVVEEWLKIQPELMAAVSIMGGGMGTAADLVNRAALKDTLLAEDVAAAETEIEGYQDTRFDGAVNDQIRSRAALALAIARGLDLNAVDESILNAAGWTRKDASGLTRADGTLSKLKDYQGPTVLEVDTQGRVKLDSKYASTLQEHMPVLAGLIGKKVLDWHTPGKIEEAAAPASPAPLSPATAAPATKPAPASSGEVSAAAPKAATQQPRGSSGQGPATPAVSGVGTPQAGAPAVSGAPAAPIDPVAQQKQRLRDQMPYVKEDDDPRPQRAWEIANHLEMAGLPRDQAEAVAIEHVKKNGIIGKSVNEQVTSDQFTSTLDELGATGDRTTRAGTEPLKITKAPAKQQSAKNPQESTRATEHPALALFATVGHGKQETTLRQQGASIQVVETEAQAEAILGSPLKKKGRKAVTALVDGKPMVIFIATNILQRPGGDMKSVIDEEFHHAAALLVLQNNPELLAQAQAEAAGLPNGNAIYNGWNNLSPTAKVIEAAAAYAAGKWQPDQTSAIRRFLDSLTEAIQKMFGLDAATAQTAAAEAIRRLADDASALLNRSQATSSQNKASPSAPKGARPEYPALRQQLAAKEISTIEALREVIRLSGERDTGVLQDLLTDHLGLKKPAAAAAVETLRSQGELAGAREDIPIASSKRKAAKGKRGQADDTFAPADTRDLPRSPAWARHRLATLAALPPRQRRWGYRYLSALEPMLAQNAGIFEAVQIGPMARRNLDGQQVAVMSLNGQVTLLIDVPAMMRNVSDLGDPRRRAQATLDEETWHAAQLHLEKTQPGKWNRDSLARQWQDLPTALKEKVWQAYHNAGNRPLPDTFSTAEAYAMQSEFLRMLGQGLIDPAAITESVDPASGLMQSLRDLLADLYNVLRKLIAGLPPSQAQTLDQQVQELQTVRARLLQPGPPSPTALQRLQILRDPVAIGQTALQNGLIWQDLPQRDSLFSPEGLARVWDLLTPAFQRQAAQLDPALAQAKTPQAKTKRLLEILLDPDHARSLAQTLLQPGATQQTSTSVLRRILGSLATYFRNPPKATFDRAMKGLDTHSALVLAHLRSLLVQARSEFEAAAGVQTVTSAALQEAITTASIAGVNTQDQDEIRANLRRTAQQSAEAMQAAWAQEAQQRAFFDAAAALAEQMMPGVSDALQQRALVRQLTGQSWEALKARMEANLAQVGAPAATAQPSQATTPLALPSPAMRSAQAIQELLTDRDNLAQQNTSPAAREEIARRLLQEEWSAAILQVAAQAERRYYANAGELSPADQRQIEALLQVVRGDLTLGWQADRRQMGANPESGAPIRMMGLARENALNALGITIEPDGTAWADAKAPIYIERGQILIKQSTLDDLATRLPITRRQFRRSELEQRAEANLTGAPAPVTADSIAEANAERAQAITERRQAARLDALEQADRQEISEDEAESGPLVDPIADPQTGRLSPGERGDLISWLATEGSLGWPDASQGGEWDWLKPYLDEYYTFESSRTRTKILKDKQGNSIGAVEQAVTGTKLGITNSHKNAARQGRLTHPGAVVEWLIQQGVLTPAVETRETRDLSPYEGIREGTGLDAVQDAAEAAGYDVSDGIGNAVLAALEARKAARRDRKADPQTALELQTLRFERDTRSGAVAVEAHQLAALAEEGPTYVTARSPDADLTELSVLGSEWQPMDPDSREIEDYLEGHPAFRGLAEGQPERLMVTLSGGTLYGRQTIPGETILRVHDTGNTGIGLDLSDTGDFLDGAEPTEEPMDSPEADLEAEIENDLEAEPTLEDIDPDILAEAQSITLPDDPETQAAITAAYAALEADLQNGPRLAASHRWPMEQVEAARSEMYANKLEDNYTGGNAWFDPRFQKWINLGNDSHYLASGIVHEFGYGPAMAANFVRVTTETYANGKREIYAEFFGPPTRRLRKAMEDTALLRGMDPSYDVHLEANAERFYGNPDDATPPLASSDRRHPITGQPLAASSRRTGPTYPELKKPWITLATPLDNTNWENHPFGDWAADLQKPDGLIGYRGSPSNHASAGGFGNTEGNGIYLAKDRNTAAFFGRVSRIPFQQPKTPFIVQETLYLLNEDDILDQPIQADDSDWLKASKYAAQRAHNLGRGQWNPTLAGDILTALLMEAGYDSVLVKDAPGDWVVLLRLKRPDQKTVPKLASSDRRPTQVEPGFYSTLAEVIRAKMPNRADARTLRGLVENPQTRIKAEELKWSGLLPWADSQPQPLTKQQVLDFLDTEGRVKFMVTRLGQQQPFALEWKQDTDNLISATLPNGNDVTIYFDSTGEFPGATMSILTMDAVDVGDEQEFDSVESAKAAAVEFVRAQKQDTPARNTQWTIPGGTNPQEVVVTWKQPKTENREPATPNTDSDRTHYGDLDALAWYRTNDHTDANGQPGLFVEEFQSKWHQRGREEGYKPTQEEIEAQMRVMNQKRDAFLAAEKAFNAARDESRRAEYAIETWESPDGNRRAKAPQSLIDAASEATRRRAEAERILNQARNDYAATPAMPSGAIPDAPYRKDWPLMLFKRALADAVAAGKAWIGWTSGDTQADRYDLSKAVDEIKWYRKTAGTDRVVEIYFKAHSSLFLTVSPDGTILDANGTNARDMEDKPLAEAVGKDIARQILESTTDGKLDGPGLRVGGQGMRKFYDDMLVKEFGKYVKQWGGKVQKTVLAIDNGPFDKHRQEDIWRIDITPAMRESVAAGQALFARNRLDPQMLGRTVQFANQLIENNLITDFGRYVKAVSDNASDEDWKRLRPYLAGVWDIAATLNGLPIPDRTKARQLIAAFSTLRPPASPRPAARSTPRPTRPPEPANPDRTKAINLDDMAWGSGYDPGPVPDPYTTPPGRQKSPATAPTPSEAPAAEAPTPAPEGQPDFWGGANYDDYRLETRPVPEGSPMTANAIKSIAPYLISGNKGDLLGRHGTFYLDLVRRANRVLDVFGGAAIYTHFLAQQKALPAGSLWNEWEYSRSITNRQIKENPDKVIAELQGFATAFDKSFPTTETQPTHEATMEQRVRIHEWINQRLEFALPVVPRDAMGRFPLPDTPRTAALYLFLQNNMAENRVVDFDLHEGKPRSFTGGKLNGKDDFAFIFWDNKKQAMEHNRPNRLWGRDMPQIIRQASERLRNATVRQGDGWAAAAEAPEGSLVFVDTSYFPTDEQVSKKLGVMNYGGTTLGDAHPATWLSKFENYLLPRGDKVRYVVTNNFNGRVVDQLEKAGWTVLRTFRGSPKDPSHEFIALSPAAASDARLGPAPTRHYGPGGVPLSDRPVRPQSRGADGNQRGLPAGKPSQTGISDSESSLPRPGPRARSVERTMAPLPPGAKVSRNELGQWDALEAEQRALAEQADTLDDEISARIDDPNNEAKYGPATDATFRSMPWAEARDLLLTLRPGDRLIDIYGARSNPVAKVELVGQRPDGQPRYGIWFAGDTAPTNLREYIQLISEGEAAIERANQPPLQASLRQAFPDVPPPTGAEVRQILASAPRRARQSMTFDPPFKAPFGEIVRYDWSSKPVGDMQSQRVSDWDNAITNGQTGRPIVHLFKVRKPDGMHTVSLETAMGMLTAAQRSSLSALIRNHQQRQQEEAAGQLTLFAGSRSTPSQALVIYRRLTAERDRLAQEGRTLTPDQAQRLEQAEHQLGQVMMDFLPAPTTPDLRLESEPTRTRDLARTPTAEQLRLFASDRAHSVAPALDLRYTITDGQDPQTTRPTRDESNPLDPRADARSGTAQRFPSSAQDMLPWARAQGWLIDTDDLVERLRLTKETYGGDEHDVWEDELTQRAVKITKDLNGIPAFVAGSPAAYLENLRRQNALFGTGFAFEGIVDDNGTPRFVISQPWIIGTAAPQQAKEDYFRALGFDPVSQDSFYSSGRDLLITDARAANVFQHPDGSIQPIDLQTKVVSPRQAEMYENRAAAYNKGLASAPRTPAQTIEATGIAPAISVNGQAYTGSPGLFHGGILTDYVWRRVFTTQQRRDDPDKKQASKFAHEQWMDSRGSGFDDFGFLDTRSGKFLTREEAYALLTERGFATPPESWSTRNKSLDSSDLFWSQPTRPKTTHALPDGYHLTEPGLHILPASIRAHHGTPHDIDPRTGFSLNKIGTGEGAQVYGWGLYFAEAMKVAEQYRKALSYPMFRIGDKEFFKREGPEAFKKWAVGQIGQEWPSAVVRYFEHAVDQFYHDGTTYGFGFDAAAHRAKGKLRSFLEQNKVEEHRIMESLEALGRITDNVIDTTPYDDHEGRWTARAVGWKPHEESFSIDAKAYNDIWSRIGWYSATFADAPARLKAEYEAQLDVQSKEYDRLLDAGKLSSDPMVVDASYRVRLAQAALDLLNSGKVVPQANKRRGNLYTVDLLGDPAEFLDWDLPLGQQSQVIVEMFQRRAKKAMNSTYKKAFKKIHPFFFGDERSIRDVYTQFAKDIGGSAKDASMFLADMGIKGIRYTDANSRYRIEQTSHAWEVLTSTGRLVAKEPTKEAARAAMAKLQTYNYVIFDDKLVRIIEVNGKPVETSPLPASERLAQAAQKTNTTPTEAQKQAENYQTGKVSVHGLRLSIENPRGSVRRGTDANGKAWEITMPHHYGRILGTHGADKDHVDFFMGPDPDSPTAFVINQRKPGNGHFDEHKVMLGFTSAGLAARGYLDSYTKGWTGYQSIVPMTLDQLKHWLEHGKMDQPVTQAPVVSNDTKPLASSKRQTLPVKPDMDQYQTWKGTKEERDAEWQRWHRDVAQWEQAASKFADQQGNLGLFVSGIKTGQSKRPYRQARAVTRIPGKADQWRVTLFAQQITTPEHAPQGDWANNAWVPISHDEFATKQEAYLEALREIDKDYEFTTQPLFGGRRLPIAASPRQILDATSRASFNHLDRKLTLALRRMGQQAVSPEPVQNILQAIAAWKGKDAPVRNLVRSMSDLAQRELIPETVLPREIMSALRELQTATSIGQQKALDLSRAALGKVPKFSDLAFPAEYVENPTWRETMFTAMEQGQVDTLPEPLQKMAGQLRALLVEAGREAVAQGRMSPDTFEGLRTTYMPRFTKDEAEAGAGDWTKRFKLGIKDILAQRSTAFHITDTTRKGKDGLPLLINHHGRKWRFADAQARDAYYEELIQRETLDPDLGNTDWSWMTRRDSRLLHTVTPEMLKAPATMTADQRAIVARVQRQLRQQFKKENPYEPKDLIKDPVYAVMRYLAQMTHDNATAKFFNLIEKNPDWTTTTDTAGFTQIPDSSRFGTLAGKWVRDDIANQVTEMADSPNQALALYDTLLRLWKTGKTVLNPATHARNIFGNIPFAAFAGNNPLNPGNWPAYIEAFRILRQGGAEYRQLYETGVLGADYAGTELKAALQTILPGDEALPKSGNPVLAQIQAVTKRAADWAAAHSWQNLGVMAGVGAAAGGIAAGPLGAVYGAALGAAANRLYKAALFAYRFEDDIFKAAAFVKARQMGMTLDQAADHVRHWFPYYDKPTSGTIRLASRTGLPFVSFFRESARIGVNALKERPLMLATTLAIPTLITAISQAILGLSDDDLEDIRQVQRGKGAKLLGPTPLAGLPLFSMVLPFRTADGRLQQLDLSSTHPFADFLADRVENFNNQPWWQSWARASFANPVVGLFYTAATGKDAFNDRVVYDPTYSTTESLSAMLNHAYTTAAPPLAPGGTNWTLIEQSTRRTANKTMALRSPAQAVGRGVLGVDVRTADPDIYRLADQFRQDRGLAATEKGVAYPTDAAGRARKALFEELIQNQPDPEQVRRHLQTLNDLGSPVRTVSDVLDILDRRRPDGVINPKALRNPFRASLNPEARRVLDQALAAFQRARVNTPGAFSTARLKLNATTRRRETTED